MKLIIVGGVAGGASAATRARRLDESAQIILFERGPDVSFANCGLPYYLGGTIQKRDKLLVTSPERFHERFNIDVRTQTEVTRIDRLSRTVHVRNNNTGSEYAETYDKLILSPGASPFVPPIPGMDLPGVKTLRNLQDTDAIQALLEAGVKHATILGGGFIGLEVAENFVQRKIAVTIVERERQILLPMDPEMTTPIVDAMTQWGIDVVLGDSATAISKAITAGRESGSLTVSLESGREIATDLVLVGVGVRPENHLAQAAQLEVGPRGGIRVNEFLQTSDPDIYAVGDAIETTDAVLGGPAQVPLAGPANRQGRIAAANAFGAWHRYRGTQGTAILGLFGMTAGVTGANEKTLRRRALPYRRAVVHPSHHAGYYPGAEAMTLKILFEPTTGRLLGAQAVGGAGVDKRIDVLAVALQAKMTVYQLEEMELAYAPQFGSAKDPVNMAGFVASGLLRGEHPQLEIEGIADFTGNAVGGELIDVRTADEFAKGHIPGARNIPIDELRERLDEIPRGRPVATYCQVGYRGYLAMRILVQKGFEAENLQGGYRSYLMAHPPASGPHGTGNR